MRRVGNLWPDVVRFEALTQATQRAARGKRGTAQVAAFLERLEPECLALQRQLEDGSWRPGSVFRFRIFDPKEREITAVPFRDRVVHHAILGPLEPVLERRMLDASYACRRGKGTHRAIRHGQRLLRHNDNFLKLDIAAFFRSVQHDVVRETLARIVKDRRVLQLIDVVLRGPSTTETTGLPIGSLTSQWLANTLLDRLDHFVVETLRVPGYLRYMDDFVLFAEESERLREALVRVEEFVGGELRLQLKTRATRLASAHDGLPFLGFRIFRGTIRVLPANLRRYRWRLRFRRWQLAQGHISEATYRSAVTAVIAHLSHADTVGLRRRWFAEEVVHT